MRSICLRLPALLLACSTSLFVLAQQPNWTPVEDTGMLKTLQEKSGSNIPGGSKLFRFQVAMLQEQLLSISGTQARQSSITVLLPNLAGAAERFEISESSNFDAVLQERYRNIRSFSGKSLDDPGASIRLTTNSSGIQAKVYRVKDAATEMIEPIAGDRTLYAVFKKHPAAGSGRWHCGVREEGATNSVRGNAIAANRNGSSGGQLRTIRLGLSCSVEFSQACIQEIQDPIPEMEKVMYHINIILANANEIFERDLAVHVVMAQQSENAIFIDQDPYNPVGWNERTDDFSAELQSSAQRVLNEIVGSENYDIGTLFCESYSSSVSKMYSVCNNSTKGESYVTPVYLGYDQFNWLDFYLIFVHEVGHQLGAGHSFSHVMDDEEELRLQQVEPGSGITIMGYPGIAPYPLNMGQSRFNFFHARSIEAILDHLNTVNSLVSTDINAQNAPPVITQPADRTIPKSTPFVLTAQVNETPGQSLTYSWEQVDAAASSDVYGNSLAYPEKSTGPNWISIELSSSPERYFPALQTILDGKFTRNSSNGEPGTVCEALSSVGRALTFRFTVRDNVQYSANPLTIGQLAYKDMTVTVDGNSGPFRVTSQNNEEYYAAGSTQTITWSVNGTNAAPVNCASVRILLSVDGGQNFPIVLIDNTPNDGEQQVTFPANQLTRFGRIKVEAVGNVFFDISDKNFSLMPPVSFGFGTTAPASTSCGSSLPLTVQLPIQSFGGYQGLVTLNVVDHNLPAGVNTIINPTVIAAGGIASITVGNTNNLPVGTHSVVIQAIGEPPATSPVFKVLEFNVTPSAIGPEIIVDPQDRDVCSGQPTTFSCSVAPGLNCSYKWQVKRYPSTIFIDLDPGIFPSALTHTLELPDIDETMNLNEYRCIVTNFCGAATSRPAILRVTTTPSSSGDEIPVRHITCPGSDETISAWQNGAANLNYQWQVRLPDGVFQDIPLETNGTARNPELELRNVTEAMLDNVYRCKLFNNCGMSYVAYTQLELLPPSDEEDPIVYSTCVGDDVELETFVVPVENVNFQWQVKTPGGAFTDIPLTTNGTSRKSILELVNITAEMNYNVYRCRVFNECGVAYFPYVQLRLLPPNNNANPIVQSICSGGDLNLYEPANIGDNVQYQWQQKTPGGQFADIPAANNVSAVTARLQLISVTATMQNYEYRCKLMNDCGETFQQPTKLNVYTIQPPQPQTVCVGGTAEFVLNDNAQPDAMYQWQYYTPGSGFITITGNASANTSRLRIENVSGAMNNYQYRCRTLSATCSFYQSQPVTLTVVPPATITAQPVSQVGCNGGSASFTVIASGTGISYQWEVKTATANWAELANTTASILNLAAINQAMNNNKYRCKISKAGCSSMYSAEATLTVPAAPAITSQPQNKQSCNGIPVSFNVTATGDNLVYRWQVKVSEPEGWLDVNNPSLYTGISTNTLTLITVPTSLNGRKYRCIVSNGQCSPLPSGEALLTTDALYITNHPQNKSACIGSSVVFSATGNSTNISYQWELKTPTGNWTAIAGATASTYSLAAITSGMNGNKYRCRISKAGCNSPFSAEATLTVNVPPVIRSSPSAVTSCLLGTAVFTVIAEGSGLLYQWEVKTATQDWSMLAGETNSSLTLPAPPLAMHGNTYRCKVSLNGCVSISAAAVLSVLGVTSQPVAVSPCPGGNARFSVQVNGQPQSYRWYLIPNNGTPIVPVDPVLNPSAATRELVLTNVQVNQRGYYFCKITYAIPSCTINSASANLWIQSPPVINIQPRNQTVCMGNTAQFVVETNGGPYAYQWEIKYPTSTYFTTADFPTATTNRLDMPDVLRYWNGTKVRCVIKNTTCNLTTTTAEATLTVNTVTITSQPESVTQACTGGRTYFSMRTNCLSGSYQWYRKLSGTTSYSIITNNPSAQTNTLLLTNLDQTLNNSKYKCTFTSGTYTYTSNEATLQLLMGITATLNSPETFVVCTSSSSVLSVSTVGPVIGYQWQYSPLTNLGDYLPFADIPSAYAATLSFAGSNGVYLRQGTKLRCKVFNLCDVFYSNTTKIALVNCIVSQGLIQNSSSLPDRQPVIQLRIPALQAGADASVNNMNPLPDNAAGKRTKDVEAITLYPVPNSGNFRIRLNNDQYPSVDIKVYDQSGRLLLHKQVKGLTAGSVIPVLLEHAVNGLYQLRITRTDQPAEGAIVKTLLILDGTEQ